MNHGTQTYVPIWYLLPMLKGRPRPLPIAPKFYIPFEHFTIPCYTDILFKLTMFSWDLPSSYYTYLSKRDSQDRVVNTRAPSTQAQAAAAHDRTSGWAFVDEIIGLPHSSSDSSESSESTSSSEWSSSESTDGQSLHFVLPCPPFTKHQTSARPSLCQQVGV
jgi:hypothetical protein